MLKNECWIASTQCAIASTCRISHRHFKSHSSTAIRSFAEFSAKRCVRCCEVPVQPADELCAHVRIS